MTGQGADRGWLAALGAAGGALLWAVIEASGKGLLSDRAAVCLAVLIVVAFAAALAMAGPIGLGRSLQRALGLGAVVTGLVWLASLRHDRVADTLASPMSAMAVLVLASVPVPFLIGQARGDWRRYEALFFDAWSIVLRFGASFVFVGIVWAVVLLSNEVLQIVEIGAIDALIEHGAAPMILTGAVLGFGMAVIHELAEVIAPQLVVRLLRLLLPAVLAVMLVFLAALPMRGLLGVVTGLSPAILLLTMVAAGLALVSVTVGETDSDAARGLVLRRSAQAMALILPVVATLAGWALWLRIAQHGLTPERLFAALLAGLALAYGTLYAVAVLRGTGWMGRIRNANVAMALVVILLSGLWLTPALNAERLSAQSQLARYDAGLTALADLDVAAFSLWGRPGAAVLAELAERAKDPAQAALAALLAGDSDPGGLATAALRQAVAAAISVQPATAGGTRDTLLAGALDFQLEDWEAVCTRPASTGGPACLMVVADLLPLFPGEEAVLVLERDRAYTEMLGLYLNKDGVLVTRPVLRADGSYPTSEDAAALLLTWARTPPPLTPAAINQLGTGDSGLMVQP